MHLSSVLFSKSGSCATLGLDGPQVCLFTVLTQTHCICSLLKVCDHRYLTLQRRMY